MASNLQYLNKPQLMTSFTDKWPCHSWSFKSLAAMLGEKQFSCRIAPKSCGQKMETECSHQYVTIKQFCDWLDETADGSNPLSNFNRRDNSCYVDYKHMKDMFEDHPETFEEVQWKDFGLVGFDGYDSTIWMSSEGANTPGHQDTYGFNLITQICGKKLWILFPPSDSQYLYPTRVPYEESSIFTKVNIRRPDLQSHLKFKLSHPVVVTLCAGQTLYVPRHWWHYVESLEPSISINVWIPMAEDRKNRLSEAITRCLATSLITSLDISEDSLMQSSWLNPTESLAPTSVNLLLLKSALCHHLGESCITEHSLMNEEQQDAQDDLIDAHEFIHKGNQPTQRTKTVELIDLEIKTQQHDVTSDSGAETNKNVFGGSDCKGNVGTESDLSVKLDGISNQSLLSLLAERIKGYQIVNVDTPFYFDLEDELPIKWTDDIPQGSSPKKCKLETAVLNKSYAACTNFNDGHFNAQTSHSRIFSLGACSFDSYLKFLDNICRQIQCRHCFKGLKRYTDAKLNDRNRNLVIADTVTEIPNVSLSANDTPLERNLDGKHDTNICSSENVCSQFVELSADESFPNTIIDVHNDKINTNSPKIGDRINLLNDGHSVSETCNESFTQLSQFEVAETLLSCTLHPDVVKLISELFEEQCSYRLRQKHFFK